MSVVWLKLNTPLSPAAAVKNRLLAVAGVCSIRSSASELMAASMAWSRRSWLVSRMTRPVLSTGRFSVTSARISVSVTAPRMRSSSRLSRSTSMFSMAHTPGSIWQISMSSV